MNLEPDMRFRPKMSSTEASKLITELMNRLGRNPASGSNRENEGRYGLSEPMLVLAIKECLRNMSGNGCDVIDKHRKSFIEKVILMYCLFIQIAERLENELTDADDLMAHIAESLD